MVFFPFLNFLIAHSASLARREILALSFNERLLWSLLVVPLPIFFAGLIFSTTFRAKRRNHPLSSGPINWIIRQRTVRDRLWPGLVLSVLATPAWYAFLVSPYRIPLTLCGPLSPNPSRAGGG